MPIFDPFESHQAGLTSPISGGFDVAPNDGLDLVRVTRALMVTGAGDVTVVLRDGDTLTLPALTPGVIYPFRIRRVLSTGTTASGVKGLV